MSRVITPEIAKNLDQVGDRWTLLILRDLFLGRHRFESLKSHTGAGRATLSRRLASLIEANIVHKSAYSPGRSEYRLTEKGADLYPAAMLAWNWEVTHLPPQSGTLPFDLIHEGCGKSLLPAVSCHTCDEILSRNDVFLAGDAGTFQQQVLGMQAENKQRRKRESLAGDDESMARIAELVGDRWSILILVAMLFGVARYDDFLALLGLATNVLGQRLSHLVAAQVVAKRAYQQNPVRYHYVLSDRGEALFPFLMTVWQWAKRWTPEGELVNGLKHRCGAPLVVDVSCDHCQKSLKLNV